MQWIAVDAMGGDFAPRLVVDGALAATGHADLGVALVGRTEAIEAELQRHGAVDRARFRIVDAAEVVDDGRDAVGGAAPQAGRVDSRRGRPRRPRRGAALFSAGHTGATVMAAHAAFGMLPGVDRPALAARFRGRSIRRCCWTSAPASNAGPRTWCSSR